MINLQTIYMETDKNLIYLVKKIYRTELETEVNSMLRCGWILLYAGDNNYVVGQLNLMVCPVCNNEIEYHKFTPHGVGSRLPEVDCPACGKYTLPRGMELDEFFVDKKANKAKSAGT